MGGRYKGLMAEFPRIFDIRAGQGRISAKTDRLLEGRYTILSRSGLHVTELLAAEALSRCPSAHKLLMVGHRSGALAMAAAVDKPGRIVQVECLDVHVAHLIERQVKRQRLDTVRVACRPYVEERETYDAACLQLSRNDMSGELVEDVLQQIHLALSMNGRCWVAVEGDHKRVAQRMRDLFGACTVLSKTRSVALLESVKKGSLKKIRSFEAAFDMTLPGGYRIHLSTLPGVFAHRRVDEGAQALAETIDVVDGDSVLDLGCGCGAVGLALAARAKLRKATFVDSHVRAVHVTRLNSERNGWRDVDVQLSDCGPGGDERFTVFAGNPPYFGDFKIAGFFLQVAAERLEPGGRAYIVSKQGERISELAREGFGNADILRRRGYDIVRSVR